MKDQLNYKVLTSFSDKDNREFKLKLIGEGAIQGVEYRVTLSYLQAVEMLRTHITEKMMFEHEFSHAETFEILEQQLKEGALNEVVWACIEELFLKLSSEGNGIRLTLSEGGDK